MPPKISRLLSEDVVAFPPPGQGKDAALEALVRAVCRKAGLANSEELLARVREREKSLSTSLDTGLCLPHARVRGLKGFFAGLDVFRAAVNGSGAPIKAMFLFFSPDEPESLPAHLEFLRGVAALFKPALLDRLEEAETPAAACALIRAAEL